MRQSHDHTGRRTPRNRPNPSARNSKETARQIGNDRLLGPENRHRPARQFLHTGLRTFKTQAKAVESLDRIRRIAYRTEKRQEEDKTVCYPQTELSYLGNVSNRLAEQFYREHGVTRIDPAFEIKPSKGVPLMFTRHCIRHMLGICKKTPAGSKFPDPLTLLYKGQKFQLHFDCKACEMTLYKKDIL